MTRRPSISLLVPTHREDRPLRRALESVRGQLKGHDEVIVIGDTCEGPLPGVEALVTEFGPRYRYAAHNAGVHDWGHAQLNYGMTLAEGDYIHCSDDDDVWAPGALEMFRAMAGIVSEPTPFLFRFLSYHGLVYWTQQGHFERNWIGGHCLLMPNVKDKLGHFGSEYNGDFDYVESAVNHYGGPAQAIWRDEIVAFARPS